MGGLSFPITRLLVCMLDPAAKLLNFCELPSNFSKIMELISSSAEYELPSPFENNSFANYKGDHVKREIKIKPEVR